MALDGSRLLVGDWNGDGIDSVGFYDPARHEFSLSDNHGDGTLGDPFEFESAPLQATPLAGDWNGDGVDTVGLYDGVSGRFLLRNSNTTGPAELLLPFAPFGSGGLPVAIDLDGDGSDGVALYDRVTARLYVNEALVANQVDLLFKFGNPGENWLPFAGDFDGDGRDGFGVYVPGSRTFYLEQVAGSSTLDRTVRLPDHPADVQLLLGDWANAGRDTVGSYEAAIDSVQLSSDSLAGAGVSNVTFTTQYFQRDVSYSSVGLAVVNSTVLSGDWNGDTIDSLGFYDPPSGSFHLRNANTVGITEILLEYGPDRSRMKAVVGDWNGDGVETVGLFDPVTAEFYLRDGNTAGTTTYRFRFGPRNSDWIPLAIDFDGNGQDGVALYNPATAYLYGTEALVAHNLDYAFKFGKPNSGWRPLVGDFDGDGRDGLGVYAAALDRFYLQQTAGSGVVDRRVRFLPPREVEVPLVGDWNGAGLETLAAYLKPEATALLTVDSLAGTSAAVISPTVSSQFFIGVAPRDGATPVPLTSRDALIAAAPVQAKTLSAEEVESLLQRAAAASASEDAIIAVVDRNGRILGVRAEQDVLDTITDQKKLVFAVDGAVAKARTAAYFANDTAPLSSRLIRFISQSTVTQREVEANPNLCDPMEMEYDGTLCGPGFVAPIGLGGHFPPEVPHTPAVDLFAIEHTNRDSIVHPGADFIRGTNTPDGQDIPLPSRFNVPTKFIAPGQEIAAPESYGFVSGWLEDAQSRGIATLPGGLAIYKDLDADGVPDVLVGGIGVFFPGPDGFATYEQGFVAGIGQSEKQRTNSAKTLEAEWIALAAVGGTIDDPIGDVNGKPPVPGIRLLAKRDIRLTLVGIELEVIGPHPDGVRFFKPGIDTILEIGAQVVGDDPNAGNSGSDLPVTTGGDLYLDGMVVPDGWLVLPHGSKVDSLSAADVQQIVNQAIAEANKVRAAIRLQPDGTFGARTRMVMSVADTHGKVLALYRMPDATYFSIDVAVAKSRNTAYFADATALEPADQVPGITPGVAFTNRTFRFLAEPRFPDGVEGSTPPVFSILRDPGVKLAPTTVAGGGENLGPPVDASVFRDANTTSVLGYDAFNVGSNFRDPSDIENQNGIVFFPGSTPLYKNNVLKGGFGVSGDGVDQDDVVTFFGADGFFPSSPLLRADQLFLDGVRLPYIKFLRNPEG